MKLGSTKMRNGDRELLDLLGKCRGCLPVPAIVRVFYPNSKQPEKKAATFTKRLRRLQRFGKVREIQGGWMIVGEPPTSTPTNTPPRLRLSA